MDILKKILNFAARSFSDSTLGILGSTDKPLKKWS